jgi:hypothetical protein
MPEHMQGTFLNAGMSNCPASNQADRNEQCRNQSGIAGMAEHPMTTKLRA